MTKYELPFKIVHGFDYPEDMPEKLIRMTDGGTPIDRVIADYIAGMTDQYAVTKFNEYFMPKAWEVDGY